MPHAKKSDTAEVIKLYQEGYSCAKIADMFSMSRQAIHERLIRNHVELRSKKVLPFIMYDGIKFTPSGHGYYRATSRKGHISLHRYKWEKEIGLIPDDWDIHHKDGNRQNNDIDNLEIYQKAEHTRVHHRLRKGLENEHNSI